MTKETWIRHIEDVTGHIRPSADNGSIAGDWKQAVALHKELRPDCEDCKARRKTYRASKNRKAREDVYKSCGLTKVIGSVSGQTYWE